MCQRMWQSNQMRIFSVGIHGYACVGSGYAQGAYDFPEIIKLEIAHIPIYELQVVEVYFNRHTTKKKKEFMSNNLFFKGELTILLP